MPAPSRTALGIGSLFLCILFTVVVCAVITQDVNKESTNQKEINEHRARTGLIFMSVPLLIVSVIMNVVSISST